MTGHGPIQDIATEMYELAENATFPDGPEGCTQSHIWWMIGELETGEITGQKAHRWLGWVQCAIVMCGGATLDTMREITRENTNNDE